MGQYIAFGLIMIMIIETVSGIAATSGRESGERAPGDFGLDPLGFATGDKDAFARLQAQEIANGRLAMWAAAGELVQGCTTHKELLRTSCNPFPTTPSKFFSPHIRYHLQCSVCLR